MDHDETAEEIRWLMKFGVHPEVIAQQLGKTPSNIRRQAFRWKYIDIVEYFAGMDSHNERKAS